MYIKRSLVKAQFTGTFNDEYPVGLCRELIDEVPSADVEEVRHGYWYYEGSDRCCSNCNEVLSEQEWFDHDWNYCPNCGSKMNKE